MINKLDKEAASLKNLKPFEDATECLTGYVFNEDAHKQITGKAVKVDMKEGKESENE